MLCCIAAAMEDITTSIRTNAASPEDADVADTNGDGTDKRELREGSMGNEAREAMGGRETDIKGTANDKRGGSETNTGGGSTRGAGTDGVVNGADIARGRRRTSAI